MRGGDSTGDSSINSVGLTHPVERGLGYWSLAHEGNRAMGTVTRKSIWGFLLLLAGCGGFLPVETEERVAAEPAEVMARPGGVPTGPGSDENPGENGAADENSEEGTNPDSEGDVDGEESNEETDPSADGTGTDSGGDDGVGTDSGSEDGTGTDDGADETSDSGIDETTDSGTDAGEDGTPDEEEAGCEPVPSFTLTDINPSSATVDEAFSPPQFEGEVSVWYFMHTS